MTEIEVGVPGGESYPLLVRRGVARQIADYVPEGAVKALLVHAPTMRELADDLAGSLRETGLQIYPFELPDAEDAKTVAVAVRAWDLMAEQAFTRSDFVVSVGGGATSDLAGFVAASWLRGVRIIHVPTSLLAMVDAAIGGKTGINIPAGKNLVGAFHQPQVVLCDPSLLLSLPTPDIAAGMAEVVKAGFIRDGRILELIESDPQTALDPSSQLIATLITRAIRVKAQVVGIDPTESGPREQLNYGHTMAHAIEQHEHYRWRHGDAVSVGMIFAADLAGDMGMIGDDLVDRHRRILSSLGLPVTYRDADLSELMPAMIRDKKNRGRTLRMVLLQGQGDPVVVGNVGGVQLARAFDRLRESGE